MATQYRRLPASLIPLIILLVAAAVWLLFFEPSVQKNDDPHSGGLLLPFLADSVARVEVTRGGEIFLLQVLGHDWQLSGHNEAGVWHDRVDSAGTEMLIRTLCESRASPVLSDSTAQRSQYGFGLPRTLTAAVTDFSGQSLIFYLGLRNPVTDRYYATGAGRSGVFTIPARVGQQLYELPGPLRLRRLWPPFQRSKVETLAIRRAGASWEELFIRSADGLWWTRLVTHRSGSVGKIVRDYDRYYSDRRWEQGGETYWRVDERTISMLLYYCNEAKIKGFGPLPTGEEELRREGLLPPTVSLRVVPQHATAALLAAFGHVTEDGFVAGMRDGRAQIFWLTGELRDALVVPQSAFLATDVLALAWTQVDSFSLRYGEQDSLRAIRIDGKWRAFLPRSSPGVDTTLAHNACSDFAHHLERLPILVVRPPARTGIPLTKKERTVLTLWSAPKGRGRPKQVVFGFLEENGEPAAYFPADGKVLVISQELLVSFRTVFRALRPRERP